MMAHTPIVHQKRPHAPPPRSPPPHPKSPLRLPPPPAGKLFVWGERNENSQLGMGQDQGVYRVAYPSIDHPVLNATLSVHPYTTRVVTSIGAGTAHSAAVTDLGVAYLWG